MEGKTNAIAITIVILILFLITLAYKIRSDKKRKSIAIPYDGTTKPKKNKSFLATTPSVVLAVITVVGATIVLFGAGEGLGSFIGNTGEAIAYILYDLVIACCCYFIIRQNPGSVWYVPVICNVLGITSAIVEPNFWITPMWIPICSGWVLSIIASVLGVRAGKRMLVSENQ